MNKPIDTSTTAGKIAVMQAFEQGYEVQFKKHWMEKYEDAAGPTWDWSAGDYRLKPREPREFTVVLAPDAIPVNALRGWEHNKRDYESGFRLIKVREVLE